MQGNSLFSCNKKKGDSMIWKGILSTWEIILRGTCFKIGNGSSFNLKRDLWLPCLVRKWLHVHEGQIATNMTKVAELLSLDSLSWNEEIVASLFNKEEVKAIMSLELPQDACEDNLCWTASEDENFTVKSCFGIIQMMGLNMENDSLWGLIWGSGLH